MINANLASAAVKEAGLSSYVNNEKENVEDEKKDRVLLAQLVEAAKGQLFYLLLLLSQSSFNLVLEYRESALDGSQSLDFQGNEAATGSRLSNLDGKHLLYSTESCLVHQWRVCVDKARQKSSPHQIGGRRIWLCVFEPLFGCWLGQESVSSGRGL